jgi:hypothetical protein
VTPAPKQQAAQPSRTAKRRIALLAIVAACSVVLAFWSWSARGQAAEKPNVSTHGFSVEQNACLRFGLVVQRTSASIPASSLPGTRVKAEILARRLPDEIASLDDTVRAYRHADYRILDSIAGVADASALVVARVGYITFGRALASRTDALIAAQTSCREIARFDTVGLTVVERAT